MKKENEDMIRCIRYERKGFHYTLEKEDILNYMKLSTKEKLTWLEEITLFTEKALTPKEKKVRDYFRNIKRQEIE